MSARTRFISKHHRRMIRRKFVIAAVITVAVPLIYALPDYGKFVDMFLCYFWLCLD